MAPTGVGGKVCQTHGPHGPHGSPNGRRQGRGVCVYILSIYVSQRLTITSLSRPSARHCKQVYCTALRHIPYDPTITRLNMAPGLSSASGGTQYHHLQNNCAKWWFQDAGMRRLALAIAVGFAGTINSGEWRERSVAASVAIM